MTDTTGTEDNGNVTVTKAEFEAMQATNRNAMAQLAGADLGNPVTDLVMKEHWSPTVTIDDMKAVVDKYNIGTPAPVVKDGEEETPITPDPEPKVEERGGPEGVGAGGDVRSNLANGTSVAGTSPGFLDPTEEAKKAFAQAQKDGLSDEDSRVLALHASLTHQGSVQAQARIAQRKTDEERVAAAFAAREAAAGN